MNISQLIKQMPPPHIAKSPARIILLFIAMSCNVKNQITQINGYYKP